MKRMNNGRKAFRFIILFHEAMVNDRTYDTPEDPFSNRMFRIGIVYYFCHYFF